MKDAPEHSSSTPSSIPPDRDSMDDPAMSALLKRALGPESIEPKSSDELLRGVQRKIRTRSKGKFFSDGWSTSTGKGNYLVVALLMLLLVSVAYLVLGPTGFR